MTTNENIPVVIVGAGPAGLTAAYHLAKNGRRAVVLEADPEYVGGISRTARHQGFHFDIGGHRFFSKSQTVEALWDELLPDDMLLRPRKSRIYYNGKFFTYPLRPFDALSKLGLWESSRCVLSYIRARMRPHPAPANFEEWVANQFGRRLFEIFFRTYTEKVWGMPCAEISADWAAQRIKSLTLGRAIVNSLLPQKSGAKKSEIVSTLINSFRYPRKGPGMMWEEAARRVKQLGGEVRMGCAAESYEALPGGKWRVHYSEGGGKRGEVEAAAVVCCAPMAESVPAISPLLQCAERAKKLRYRDFLTVALIMKDRGGFSDNWIYIHDPSVKVGRVQNYKSWSPEMSPDPERRCLGLEYFCFEGDGLWNSDDEDLLALAKRELTQLNLAPAEDVTGGCVVRQKKAYPVYDDGYAGNVAAAREELSQKHPTFHPAGRNGMHKYNNQDHAMMTGLIAAENILAGKQVRDPWLVNADAEYLEEGEAGKGSALRQVPTRA